MDMDKVRLPVRQKAAGDLGSRQRQGCETAEIVGIIEACLVDIGAAIPVEQRRRV